jgi:hypothetical protein
MLASLVRTATIIGGGDDHIVQADRQPANALHMQSAMS